MKKPAADSDRPRYPDVADDVGEDPARFLYFEGDAFGVDTKGETSPLSLAEARIRGIDRIEVAAAWQGVARNLHANGHLSERALAKVLDLLQERIQHLQEHGERPPDEELHRRAERRREQRDDTESKSHTEQLVEKKRRGEPLTASEKHHLIREGRYHDTQAVATDGGTDEGGES